MINKFLTLLLILFSLVSSAQEIVTFPTYMPEIANEFNNLHKTQKVGGINPIILPFYDDFSRISVYPSPIRWADNYAMVNTDFAKRPPTIGVATLDAIDEKGKLYSGAGSFPFEADKLTSQPIRLDSLFVPNARPIFIADSLYLSFYYQPQGRGIKPAKEDSLILEFHSPIEFDTITTNTGTSISPVWHHVWSTAGGVSVDSFAVNKNQYFKQVLVPITDSARYFKNGFQFRFRNKASLANNFVPDWKSNCDQWNIDVVWLNTNRNYQDTVIKDVAFAESAPSLLRNYYAMPYNQYNANFLNEMKDSLEISIANLDNENKNLSYKFNIRKNSAEPHYTYDGGGYFIQPYLTNGYSTYQPFAHPSLNYYYSPGTDEKVVFHSIHTITSDPNPLFRSNDTIQFSQEFSNYYAYDNGTAEAGIGLNGAAGSYVVRFELNKKDTLRGMQIYFNQVLGQSNQKLIDLIVMNDAFGKPGQIVKTIAGVTPIYSDNVNEFQSYWLDFPIEINAADFPGLIFYVGWSQSAIDNLNIGFDRYNDSHEMRFYNIYGNWEQSSSLVAGSLMLRPIIGLANPLGTDKPLTEKPLKITPNPVMDGIISIQLPEGWDQYTSESNTVKIFSANGNLVKYCNYSNQLLVNELKSGLYFLSLTNPQSGKTISGKFVIGN